MSQASNISRLLVRELEGFAREVALFPDDESLWKRLPGVSNSAGNLALHVAGNLQHFVGACLGGSGYVRNRDAEFAARGSTRDAVRRELQAAAAVVTSTLTSLDDARLQQQMPNAPRNMETTTGMFLLHSVAHIAFHLGQAGYLRRVVTGDNTSANPLPLDVLTSAGHAG